MSKSWGNDTGSADFEIQPCFWKNNKGAVLKMTPAEIGWHLQAKLVGVLLGFKLGFFENLLLL